LPLAINHEVAAQQVAAGGHESQNGRKPHMRIFEIQNLDGLPLASHLIARRIWSPAISLAAKIKPLHQTQSRGGCPTLRFLQGGVRNVETSGPIRAAQSLLDSSRPPEKLT
jgi:hypothetical protein